MNNLFKKRNFLTCFFVCVLFTILFNVGLNLAKNKYIWGDEFYSQKNIERSSYADIILGIRGEGNTSPLFYLIQKVMCDITNYQTPDFWEKGSGGFVDPYARKFLRIAPIVCMSLAVVLIFLYFSRRYSFAIGLYSIFISMSSYMLWLYWAEARPYALWFLLTTIQLLIFLILVDRGKSSPAWYRGLVATHILLALSVITSAAQIVVVSAVLWFLKERDLRKYIMLTAVPLCICIYYATQTSLSPMVVPEPAIIQLIIPNFPPDRMLIILIFVLFLFWPGREIKGKPFLMLTALIFLAALVMLEMFKMRSPGLKEGIPLSIRYFIFLTPLNIIATTLFSTELIKVFEDYPWLQVNVIMCVGALVTIGFFRNCFWVIGLY